MLSLSSLRLLCFLPWLDFLSAERTAFLVSVQINWATFILSFPLSGLLGLGIPPAFLWLPSLCVTSALIGDVCGVCTHMFLAERTVLLCPAYLAFLGIRASMESIFLLESAPFDLSLLGGLSLSLTLLSMFSRTSKRVLALTRVEFSMRSYCRCHLTGHIHNRWVERLASSSGITVLVAEFTFRLLNKPGKLSR